MHGPPLVQRATIRDVFDPTAVWDESLFCHHVSKFICIKLSKSSLLGDMDLLAARELELGPVEGLNHMPLVLQLGVNRHYNLAKVDSGHCALGFPKAPRISVWSLDWGQHASHECPLERAVSRVP